MDSALKSEKNSAIKKDGFLVGARLHQMLKSTHFDFFSSLRMVLRRPI